MDIQFIREFVTLCESFDLAEAADKCYLSPSVLSKHIRKLENELGRTLFDRTTRTMLPNREGQLFLTYARKIISDYDEYIAQSNFNEEQHREHISIGLSASWALASLEEIIQEFYKQNSEIELDIFSRENTDKLYDLLISGRVDFVFSYDVDANEDNLISMSLKGDNLAVVMPTDHPLTSKDRITCADLNDQRIMMQNADKRIFHKITSYFSAFCEPLNMAFAVNSEEMIIEMLEYSKGIVGLMLKGNAERLVTPTLTIRTLEPKLNFSLFMQYIGKKNMSHIDQTFIHFIEQKFYSN